MSSSADAGPAGVGPCLDPDAVIAFVGRSLSAQAAAEVERHIALCETCRVLLSTLAHEAYSAGTVPSDRPPTQRDILDRGASVGRYLVLSLLGRGGMSEVYVAYDPDLDRRVALKLMHAARGSKSARKRLAREARALAKLSHPNVVQVYDVGEHEGDVFLAMELVDGQDLGAWARSSPRPPWQEVLAAYLDAARGLAAAHAEDLIHRDVKPSNIVRGHDGRVRVVDFGLVAGLTEEHAEGPGQLSTPESLGRLLATTDTLPAPASEGSLTSDLTAAGALLGTPLYMAPEQFDGSGVGPASDQYSLCAAMFEGLYGVPPFKSSPGEPPGRMILRLAEQKRRPPTPEASSDVPQWVYNALHRGLSPRPEDRFPSLTELVATLGEDPDSRRPGKRRAVLAIGLAAVALAAVGIEERYRSAAHDPCSHPEAQLADIWDNGAKIRAHAAFVGSGPSYAEETYGRVTAVLDRYAGEWARMRGEVCEAARAGPTPALRLRDACLDRRRSQLSALTRILTEKVDPTVLDKAVAAAIGLPTVASCVDTAALMARVQPPEDPAVREQVTAIEPRVDQLEALFATGNYRAGLAFGEPLLGAAAAVPYAPLLARAQYWVGRLRDRTGDEEGSKAMLREAAASAARGGDDSLVALAWASVLYVLGERQRRFDEAKAVREFGPTLLARAHDESTEATWLREEGLTLYRMGSYADAKDRLARSVTLLERLLGKDHLETLLSLNNLGTVLNEMGEHEEAIAVFERVLERREASLGPNHPSVAYTLVNLGNSLLVVGDLSRAREAEARAVTIRESALGSNSPDVALSLNDLAGVVWATGEYAEARALHERALAIREKALGPDHPDVAQSLTNVGAALFGLGDYAGSLAMCQRALSILEKKLPPDHPDLAYPLLGIGRALVRLNHGDAAFRALDRARELREKTKGGDVSEPLLELGVLYLAQRNAKAAVTVLERALASASPLAGGDIHLALADGLWQTGSDRPRARELAEWARAYYERIGHRPGLDRSTRWLTDHPAPHS